MARTPWKMAGRPSDDASASSSSVAVETREIDAAWAARWQWQYLAGYDLSDRIATVTGQVWQRGYAVGYHDAYFGTVQHVAEAARQAAEHHREAAAALALVSAAAFAVADQARREMPTTPPTDPHALVAAHAAAATNEQQPWKPLARAVWAGATAAGRDKGTLDARVGILNDWDSRGGTSALPVRLS